MISSARLEVVMLGSASLVAFAASTDVARSRHFYETVLGLQLVDENPYACVFSSGQGTLRVVPVDSHVPSGYTVVGWVVPDIDETVRALADAGVGVTRYGGIGQDEVGIWTTPGETELLGLLTLTETSSQ